MLRKIIVTALAVTVLVAMSISGALARGGFGSYRGAGLVGVGLGYGYPYYGYGGPYYYGAGYGYGYCPYVYRTVMTPWGWRRRLVQVCY